MLSSACRQCSQHAFCVRNDCGHHTTLRALVLQVRKSILKEVASQLRPELEAVVAAQDAQLQGEYSPDSASAARRCAPAPSKSKCLIHNAMQIHSMIRSHFHASYLRESLIFIISVGVNFLSCDAVKRTGTG